MSEGESPTPALPVGAMCGVHVDQPARVVCLRCGDFACGACVPPDLDAVCPACRARGVGVGSLLNRDNWTVSAVFNRATELLKEDFLGTLGVIWLGSIIYYVLAMTPGMVIAFSAPQWAQSTAGQLTTPTIAAAMFVVTSPFVMGIYAYSAARVRGEQAGVGHLFGQFHRLPAVLPLGLLQLVLSVPAALLAPDTSETDPAEVFEQLGALAGQSMLLAVWGMAVYLVMQFALMEVMLAGSGGGIQALRAMLGHFGRNPFPIAGTAILLSMISFLSIMCCFLPAIVGVPFATLGFTVLYMAARTPPG